MTCFPSRSIAGTSSTSGAGVASGSSKGSGATTSTGGGVSGFGEPKGRIRALIGVPGGETFLTFFTGSRRSTVGPWTLGLAGSLAGVGAAESVAGRVERDPGPARRAAAGFLSVDFFWIFSAILKLFAGGSVHVRPSGGGFAGQSLGCFKNPLAGFDVSSKGFCDIIWSSKENDLD